MTPIKDGFCVYNDSCPLGFFRLPYILLRSQLWCAVPTVVLSVKSLMFMATVSVLVAKSILILAEDPTLSRRSSLRKLPSKFTWLLSFI